MDLRRGGGTATGGGSVSPAGEEATLTLSGDAEELLVTSSSERESPKGSSVLRRWRRFLLSTPPVLLATM